MRSSGRLDRPISITQMVSERSGEEIDNVIFKIFANQNLNQPKPVMIVNDVMLFFLKRSATVKLLITSS